MSKKLFLILAFLLAAIVIALALYYVFFRPAPATPPATPPVNTTGTLPIIGPNGEVITPTSTISLPSVVTDLTTSASFIINQKEIGAPALVKETAVLNPEAIITSADGNLKYYDRGTGTFYRLDSDGQIVPLSDKKFIGVSDVQWSPDTSRAILQFPDGFNVFYDFQQQRQVTLPQNWSNFSFSPNSQKIAFINDDLLESNRWLASANPDGSEVALIEPVGANADKVIVDWSPNNQVVALSRTGEAMGAWLQEVYLIGLHSENFRSLTINGRGFEVQWSPTGRQLLYSVYNEESQYKPTLWLTEAQGDDIGLNNHSLQIDTWAEKCAFSPDGKKIYCGVPTQLAEGDGMVGGASWRTMDYLYQIDLTTGQRSLLDYSGQFNVSDLRVSDNGQKLYFSDRVNNVLREVDLP